MTRYRDNVTKRYTPEERQAAIEAYRSNGPAYVESEFGVKRNTVQVWAKRAGVSLATSRRSEATIASVEEWGLRRARLANESGRVAEAALARVSEAVAGGRPHDAKAYAGVLSTLVANAQLLTGSATSRTENVETVRNEGEAILAELEAAMRGPAR